METNELTHSPAATLGAKLRAVRNLAGMSQEAVGVALGMTAKAGHVYVSKLERGRVPKASFWAIVRYVQACKVPVGKFMLELAQSGAFGEAEAESVRDFTAERQVSNEQAKRAKAKQLSERRSEQEAQDSAVVAQLWREVAAAIQPVLAQELPSRRHLAPYLEGVRSFYRAWKQATRGAGDKDSTPDVKAAFDRIEQLGCQRLVPVAVRKMREVVFERLMKQGENPKL